MADSQCFCCATVPQDKLVVVETFGKFNGLKSGGLNFINCCMGECVAGEVSLRVQQIEVIAETKTLDNVFVHCTISVQYEVNREKAYEAYYKLTNPGSQITAYVYDTVRSSIPKLNLDDVFDNKEEIAMAVKRELTTIMPDYGYNIIQALVVDISPNEKVKRAMNEINASSRLRVAAKEKAEAEKIVVVTAAEAEAESKYLQGVGISRQRQAIVAGLQESVVSFTNDVGDISPKDVLQLMLMTQYFDAMREIGQSPGSNVVFVPSSAGAVGDIGSQVRQAMLEASAGSPGVEQITRKSKGMSARLFGKSNPAE